MWYCPTATEVAPWWTTFSCALGLFIYQTLDAIDGKQARRTKTNSPLGELFDHGCDSLSTVFVSVASCCAVRLGIYPGWMLFQVDLDFWLSSNTKTLLVPVCFYSLLLCSLANLCVGNTPVRDNWCDRRTNCCDVGHAHIIIWKFLWYGYMVFQCEFSVTYWKTPSQFHRAIM